MSFLMIGVLVGVGLAVALFAWSALRRPGRREHTAPTQRGGSPTQRSPASQPAPIGLFLVSATHLNFDQILCAPPATSAPRATSGDANLVAAADGAVTAAAERLARWRNLLVALSNERLDPQELAALIQSEPGLARAMLERINGPEYEFRTPIDQISRAVVLLGHVEVRLLAWRLCLSDGIRPSSSMTSSAFDSHWQHACTVARTAQALATTSSLPRPDILVTAGVLHDIGKLLALAQWPDRARAFDRVRFSDAQAHTTELTRLGIGHAHLGARFCDALGVSADVRQLVEAHHAPSYGPPSQPGAKDTAVAVVHLADVLSHLTQAHLQGAAPPAIYGPSAGWLELLKLRRIEDALTQNVVLALLDPALGWRGIPGVGRAA
jgi:putative nucleotidyltransferase with HDIG domain